MNVKPIKLILFIETILGIYRNISERNQTTRAFMYIVLSLDLCFSILNIVVRSILISTNMIIQKFYYDIIFQINLILCDFRFVFEYFATSCILFVMSEQLESITRSIANEISINKSGIDINQFEDWATVFGNVAKCSKLFNQIFGLQDNYIKHCIITSIFAFFLYLQGGVRSFSFTVYLLKLAVYFAILYMLSLEGYRLEKSVDLLRRQLAKVLLQYPVDSKSHMDTRNLIRLTSSHPIRTQGFGGIDINLTLIPTCVMFFTTYTVIALQFNNVL
ncbi:uncharacterized protein [Epargyreus clarus]|uniref:uncharacterized protein n=1 Tax=Epargyreus clarus TaxID=520877 RepID=UPI003C2D40A1